MQQAIEAYYTALRTYGGLGVTRESSLRSAMQTLLDTAGCEAGWKLTPEHHLPNGKIPDGTFLDAFKIAHGYWEAKDTKDDIEIEIEKKFAIGYPADNIIFEDTRRAVLFQGRHNRFEYDLTQRDELLALLRQFTSYQKPHFENFKRAVDEFAMELPKLAKGTQAIIERERESNPAFIAAFGQFHELCMNALNPQISAETIEEMLVQHLLTERLFRTIFENPDFTRRNVIAAEIEKVIDSLMKRSFNRADFLKSLDRFYVPIETEGRGITEWNDKQEFLNKVYERFFQGFSVKQADTHGVVYTPQPIVNFMLASVEHLLQTEFGSSLSARGVNVLDPCTGTGNFVVNLLRHHIARRDMQRKYAEELFANEIMLLPYYIASLNIEHAYYELMGEYAAFEGLCFADTLKLADPEQMALFSEVNADRTEREKKSPITVIVGNPPYNAHQQYENDNNKNVRYRFVEDKITSTYMKASKATNKNALWDAYVKFFRWATDRLKGEDGIICYVSNNSFLEQFAFDGMRKFLAEEFTTIYHLDCGGNVRKNPRLSGTTHNVFGIQVGVGITILVRRQNENAKKQIFYYAMGEDDRATDKLAELSKYKDITSVAWKELTPDAKNSWLTDKFHADFDTFLPLGNKTGKAAKGEPETIFKTYSNGLKSNRDSIVYDADAARLAKRMKQFIADYNSEVDRWVRSDKRVTVDNFVSYEKVNWSEGLKNYLKRGKIATFDEAKIRQAMYRPFCTQYLYFDALLNERRYQLDYIFPHVEQETENKVIWLKVGSEVPMFALVTNILPDLLPQGGSQCFPFYTYDLDEEGKVVRRKENITDWALGQFREAHGPAVTKWDIFYYVYALLHSPAYRARYAENLKRELPRIPLAPPRHGGTEEAPGEENERGILLKEDAADVLLSSPATSSENPPRLRASVVQNEFFRVAAIGKRLADLHRDYENAAEYGLQAIENRDVPYQWRVEKMKLSKDRTQIVVNASLTLAGIPAEVFGYRLGNRSALEWVIDQYAVTTDKRSGLVSDPNREEAKDYIVGLIGKVITVSLETVRLVRELEGAERIAG